MESHVTAVRILIGISPPSEPNSSLQTVSNISQSSVVQTAWRKGVPLSIHGWVYHVDSGRITDLEVQEGIWEDEEVKSAPASNRWANGVKVNGAGRA